MLLSLAKTIASKRIVLASSSPRRKEIMEKIGLPCSIHSPSVEENLSISAYSSIPSYVEALARLKAEAAILSLGCAHTYDLLIAADTVVVLNGQIIGKPRDRQDAVEILKRLSGKSHLVITGVCIYCCTSERDSEMDIFHEVTTVKMGEMDTAVIEAYVDSGEPLDKAGAYGIQGQGCSLVERIDGDYYNVVGLPAHKMCVHIRSLCEKMLV
ncbi:unnamed protein product [Calicophoron daubneyi]